MSTPTPEQWQRIEDVLDEALDLPSEERAAYLDRACPDEALRAQVERLLAADAQAGSFLDAPARDFAAPLLDVLNPQGEATEAPGVVDRRVGAYRLVDMLGKAAWGPSTWPNAPTASLSIAWR